MARFVEDTIVSLIICCVEDVDMIFVVGCFSIWDPFSFFERL
jgi:hypothetical protein